RVLPQRHLRDRRVHEEESDLAGVSEGVTPSPASGSRRRSFRRRWLPLGSVRGRARWHLRSFRPTAVSPRSFNSRLDATRMWRSTERASLEKKPSIRLSQEPCFGVKTKVKRPCGWAASQALVSLEMCAE